MHNPQTALVVEDSPELRLVLEALFKNLGMQAVSVRDGESALTAARARRPDIVCLDVMLPVACGVDVCRQLKRQPETADVPVLIVSARRTPQDRANARAAGADGYLTKPIERGEFAATVRRLLWQARAAAGVRG